MNNAAGLLLTLPQRKHKTHTQTPGIIINTSAQPHTHIESYAEKVGPEKTGLNYFLHVCR